MIGWRAEYTTGGKHSKVYSVDVQSDECPVSVATPEIRQLIQIETMNHQIKEAAGSSMYGHDVCKWPAWFVDLVAMIEQQRIAESNARSRAEMD